VFTRATALTPACLIVSAQVRAGSSAGNRVRRVSANPLMEVRALSGARLGRRRALCNQILSG